MNTIKNALASALLLALLICVLIVGWHLPRWTRAIDATLIHVDEFAGRGARAMGKVEQAADNSSRASARMVAGATEAVKFIDHATGAIDAVEPRALAVIDASTDTIAAARGPLNSLTVTLGHVNPLLDDASDQLPKVGAMLTSSTKLMNDADGVVTGKDFAGFLAGLSKTSTAVSDSTATFNVWFQARMHPPKASGRLGWLVNGARIVRGAAQLAQPAYYTKGVFQ